MTSSQVMCELCKFFSLLCNFYEVKDAHLCSSKFILIIYLYK